MMSATPTPAYPLRRMARAAADTMRSCVTCLAVLRLQAVDFGMTSIISVQRLWSMLPTISTLGAASPAQRDWALRWTAGSCIAGSPNQCKDAWHALDIGHDMNPDELLDKCNGAGHVNRSGRASPHWHAFVLYGHETSRHQLLFLQQFGFTLTQRRRMNRAFFTCATRNKKDSH